MRHVASRDPGTGALAAATVDLGLTVAGSPVGRSVSLLAPHRVAALVTRLVPAVKHVSEAEGINIVVNSGSAAGQDEPHYHVHIIPRRHGDGFDIPLPFNGSQMPDRTVLDAFAARIISALRDPMRIGLGN